MKFMKYNVECCYGGVAHLGALKAQLHNPKNKNLITQSDRIDMGA